MPACPTTTQRYYPNGHRRHNSDSFSSFYRPVYESLACFRNKTDTASDNSHVSADVTKRSADDDSPIGTDDTTTDNNQEQDDTSIEEITDDETVSR